MEEKPLYGALTVYRERGAYLRRRELFGPALSAYDQGWLSAPEDVRLLLGRSLVGIDTVKPHQAYTDAEFAYSLDPSNITSRYVRATALYAMSEFERSLVMHYRGVRIRKQPPYFQEGVHLGEAAIKNCIGEYAGNVLHNFLPLIKKTAIKDEDDPEPNLHKSRIPQPITTKKLTQMEMFKHKTLSRVLAMKYLGPMAYDKFFLQRFIDDPRVKGANSNGSRQLKNLAEEALSSLSQRQEMLRSQRPYYSVQWAEKTESKHETQYKKRQLESERRINIRTAERLVKQVEKCMQDYRIKDMVTKAERMQIFLDSKTPRVLPEKDHYIDRLYRIVGDGYLAQHRLTNKSERSIRRRIAFLMGLHVGRPTSYDSVMAKYPYKFIDPKTALENLMKSLDVCENSYMKCWLLYEISYLMNRQKNYPLAKFYAKQLQREAELIGSPTWWLNGCFLLMSGDMQQGNTNDVKVQVLEAMQYTRLVKDSENTQAFLSRCAELAGQALQDDDHAVARRQNQILNVIDESLVAETKVLFKKISTLPTGRRFSVLPSKPLKTMEATRKKRRQRGISIIPGQEKGLHIAPRSTLPGYQNFE